jgi:hypothetical protein
MLSSQSTQNYQSNFAIHYSLKDDSAHTQKHYQTINRDITDLSFAEKDKFIDAESALLIWNNLFKKGLPKANTKQAEASKRYQVLCLKYRIAPRV